MTRPGEPDQFGVVRDREDGSYEVVPTVTSASGMWKLHVTLGGVQIAGGPFDVAVSAGPTDAFASIAAGDGIKQAYTGEVSVFMLRTKDAYGNGPRGGRRRRPGGARAGVDEPGGPREGRRHGRRHVHAAVYDRDQSGDDYILSVYVNNGTIGGSPFRVVALAGPTNCGATISVRAPHCVAGTVSEAPIFARTAKATSARAAATSSRRRCR